MYARRWSSVSANKRIFMALPPNYNPHYFAPPTTPYIVLLIVFLRHTRVPRNQTYVQLRTPFGYKAGRIAYVT